MVKQTIISIINELPENFSIDEFMYKLYILSNHEKALQDIENGNVYSTEEVRKIISAKSVVSV